MNDVKMELYNDNFQNFKQYNIPKAQLVIADIPYNVGTNFYGSNPEWYNDGDNSNGESDKAGKAAKEAPTEEFVRDDTGLPFPIED